MSRALESLHTVRRGEEAAARDALAVELRAEESALASLAQAREALERADAALREARDAPATTAAARCDRDAYAGRKRLERQRALGAHQAAAEVLAARSRRVEAAREALTLAYAEKRVTETRLDREAEAERRETERREEDDAEDAGR